MKAEKNAELIDLSDHVEKAVYGYLFIHGGRSVPYDILQIDGASQNLIYKNRRILKNYLEGFSFTKEGISVDLSEQELHRKIRDALCFEIARCYLQPSRLIEVFFCQQEISPQEQKFFDACLQCLEKIDFSAPVSPAELDEYGRVCKNLRSLPLRFLRKYGAAAAPEQALSIMIPSFRLDFSPDRYPNVKTIFCCFAKETYS